MILTELSLDVMKAQEHLLDATSTQDIDALISKIKTHLDELIHTEARLNKFQQLLQQQNNVPENPKEDGANS